MKYTKANNTYFAKPKDDPKDRIELEVGDSKQSDFYPQVKVMRWDNEVNFSARLVHDEKTPTVSKVGEKIKWIGDKVEVNTYALTEDEGGYEFEVILKEKPKSNVVKFTIQTKGLDFFYQPELTQEEKDIGVIRPDNVIGSYAVYASENKVNYVGGKEYKCGKVGHIFRPKIIDSAGIEIWGELHIENGVLSVTIPQSFLDKAVYPVRHAAGLTFGYTTQGSGLENVSNNGWRGSLFTSPSDASAATSISVGDPAFSNGKHVKGIIVLHSNLTIVTNAITPAITFNNTSNFKTGTFSVSPTISPSTDYVLSIVADGTWIQYDSGAANQSHSESDNNYTSPTDPTSITHDTKKFSIYCTYTAGGGESTFTPTKLLLGVG